METLSDSTMTTLILVSRPEVAPMLEASRASEELKELGVFNQLLIINGVLPSFDREDEIGQAFFDKQQKALANMPQGLEHLKKYVIPLRAYNITGINNVRRFLKDDAVK